MKGQIKKLLVHVTPGQDGRTERMDGYVWYQDGTHKKLVNLNRKAVDDMLKKMPAKAWKGA